MTADRLEYRERTAVWDADSGTVELYMAWKRDFDSCMGRLRQTGVTPVQVEELNPGYRILLGSDDAVNYKMLIRPKRREPSEEERDRRREAMAAMRTAQLEKRTLAEAQS